MIEFGSSRTGSSALPRRLDASNTQIKPRKTTDKLCLVLFFVLIGSIAFITIRDIKTTEFKHLMKPLDAAGNTCGENGASLDYTEYPYVYIDYPSKDSAALSQRVCVKSCPQSSSESLLCQPNQLVPLCNKLTVYSSKLVAGRLCVPSDLTFYKSISERLYSLDSSSVFEAATTNYRLIVFSLLIAMILSFTYSKLLTHYSFFIVLGSFGLAYGGIAVLGVLSYSKYGMLMRESETASDSVKMQQAAASYKVGAGMLWIVSAGLTFLTFMMIGRIRAAVGVIQTASRFVSENKVIVIVPILGLVSAVFVVIAWIFSALAFYSRATKKQSEESGYARIDWKYHKREIMVLVFTLAWSLSVVFTGIRFVIATTVALWYNQECNNSLVRVLKAVYWTLRFHLGTVCFGSLILFLAGVGKVVCQYIITKVPAPAGLQQVHWIISKCLVILVFLAERLIKFFTSQTLTQVALSSESFCTSASEVSKVMSISILKFDFICEFLLLGGKLVISIGSTLISRILLKKGILSESIGSTLSVEFLTLTAIFALSWIVSSMFAYLWSAACDSVITLQAFEKISRNTNYESKLGNTVNDSMDEFAANPDYI